MARMPPEAANAVNVIATYLASVGDQVPAEVIRALEALAVEGSDNA